MLEYQFLQHEFLSNSSKDYLLALLLFFGFLVLFKLFQVVILKKLKRLAQKTKTDIDDAFIKIIKSLKPPFYSFLAFLLLL